MRISTKYLFTGFSIFSLLSPFALALSAHAVPSSKTVDMVAFEEKGNTGVGTYMLGINQNAGVSRWTSSNLPNWTKPQEFELGDLNGDGRSDIVAFEKTATTQGNYMLGINRGNNQFTWVASNLQNWAVPTSFQVGDVNGDGRADIVAYEPISSNSGTFRVGMNLDNNKFAWLTSNLQNWEAVTQWRLADMNGDSKADIVAFQAQDVGQTRGNYYIGQTLANASFSWSEVLGGFLKPHELEVGDLNGDGRMDFVATEAASAGGVNYMEAVASGLPIGGSLANPAYNWGVSNLKNWTEPYSFQLGDMFKDGKTDIVAAESQSSNQVTYYQANNLGNNQFTWGPNLQNFETPAGFRLGNIDDQ